MTKNICFLSITLLFLVSCNSKYKYNIEKSEHGLTIHQDSLNINVEIIDEAIIHVNKILNTSTPSEIPDYVTVLEPQKVDWKLEESSEKITISTKLVKVFVNSDGTITYETKDGKNLLSETNQHTFINSEEAGKEHHVSQGFHAGDEGLYGLGQFQSGIMNWKNVPIRLQQYNQEIAIPFLVSTKGMVFIGIIIVLLILIILKMR